MKFFFILCLTILGADTAELFFTIFCFQLFICIHFSKEKTSFSLTFFSFYLQMKVFLKLLCFIVLDEQLWGPFKQWWQSLLGRRKQDLSSSNKTVVWDKFRKTFQNESLSWNIKALNFHWKQMLKVFCCEISTWKLIFAFTWRRNPFYCQTLNWKDDGALKLWVTLTLSQRNWRHDDKRLFIIPQALLRFLVRKFGLEAFAKYLLKVCFKLKSKAHVTT